jgi:hypothetical protein
MKLGLIKDILLARGYRFELVDTPEGPEEHIYHPSGDLVIVARKPQEAARPVAAAPVPVPVP